MVTKYMVVSLKEKELEDKLNELKETYEEIEIKAMTYNPLERKHVVVLYLTDLDEVQEHPAEHTQV